jgi:urea transport system permease protein
MMPKALLSCLTALLLALCASAVCRAADAESAVPAEIVDAIKKLNDTDEAGRRATYDLIAAKGDARLIPALKAYKDGGLQIINDRLAIYGLRVNIPEKGGMVLPLQDAVSGELIKGADGKPLYFLKPDLSKGIKSPPRPERPQLLDLIASLSLLDPDPMLRAQSIREVGERAGRAFVSSENQRQFQDKLTAAAAKLEEVASRLPAGAAADAMRPLPALLRQAAAQKPGKLLDVVPDAPTTLKLVAALAVAETETAFKSLPTNAPTTLPASATTATPLAILTETLLAARAHADDLELQQKVLDDLTKYAAVLKRQQLAGKSSGPVESALEEAVASVDLVLGGRPARLAAVDKLGRMATSRAANLLRKFTDAVRWVPDADLQKAADASLVKADRYQSQVRFIQDTFASISLGSILILLALGLSIIFGLMGVINMAHGEFMMVGAFTTYLVCEAFKRWAPGAFDWYLVAAIPAAFLASALVGLLCEWAVVRHLYNRPLETLLATWGISLILIQAARVRFGDTLSVTPPRWMEGGMEFAADLVFPRNRLFIIAFCIACIAVAYFIVNRTKLGLLIRATSQNREMAESLGIATRTVDAVTFAFGAGLAGLAGVVVPLYNKINPQIGQEYIVDSFMVVVVGGVGKLAGVIIAGLGLGFANKYLESLLGMLPSISSGASVIGKVLVLIFVVAFLQRRPAGLFPPRGRLADA